MPRISPRGKIFYILPYMEGCENHKTHKQLIFGLDNVANRLHIVYDFQFNYNTLPMYRFQVISINTIYGMV